MIRSIRPGSMDRINPAPVMPRTLIPERNPQ